MSNPQMSEAPTGRKIWPTIVTLGTLALAARLRRDDPRSEAAPGNFGGGNEHGHVKAPAAEERSQGWLARSMALISDWRSIIIILLLGVVILLENARGAVVIEPIDVPDELVKRGITKDELALQLRDNLAQAAARANVAQPAREISLHSQQPDFTVPAVGFSVRAMVGWISSFVGIGPTRISGAVTVERPQGTYRLILRNSAATPERIFDETGPIDKLLNRAALSVLTGIDPVIAAEYILGEPDLPRAAAIEIASKLLAESSARQSKDIVTRTWDRLQNNDLALARAHFLWGQVLSKGDVLDHAVAAFDRADQEYQRVRPSSSGWAVARDEKGWMLHTAATDRLVNDREKRVAAEKAVEAYKAALNADRDYVSAIVHLGDHKKNLEMFCKAIKSYRRAARIDPMYAMAWKGWGEAASQLRRLNKGCRRVVAPYNDPEFLFARAVGAAPKWVDPWTQWGIYLFEQKRFEEADVRLRHATELAPKSAFVWQRLGRNQLKQAKKANVSPRAALGSLCRAVRFEPHKAEHMAELKLAQQYVAERNEPSYTCEQLDAQDKAAALADKVWSGFWKLSASFWR
jgi:tetratricopeptide (TPR) repeat protein